MYSDLDVQEFIRLAHDVCVCAARKTRENTTEPLIALIAYDLSDKQKAKATVGFYTSEQIIEKGRESTVFQMKINTFNEHLSRMPNEYKQNRFLVVDCRNGVNISFLEDELLAQICSKQ